MGGLGEADFSRIGVGEMAGVGAVRPGSSFTFASALVEDLAVVPYADAVGLGAWLVAESEFAFESEAAVPLVDATWWGGALEAPRGYTSCFPHRAAQQPNG